MSDLYHPQIRYFNPSVCVHSFIHSFVLYDLFVDLIATLCYPFRSDKTQKKAK